MVRCLIFLFCLVAPNLLFSQDPSNTETTTDGSYVEREEKLFRFFPGGKMQIASEVPGSIRIIGWKKATVQVEAEKIVEGLSQELAKEEIEKHPLRVRWNQTSANIQVSGIPEETVSIRCNLTIYVPGDRTDMQATISRGDIHVEKVNGWVEITTIRGDLGASSMSGYFSGSTQNGNIRVDMSGNRWRGLEFSAMTLMGSIDLHLPEDYSAALKLETKDGEVTIDYPPRMVDGEPVPLTVGIRKKAQAIDSLIGTGGAPITLVSNAGNITLSLKDK